MCKKGIVASIVMAGVVFCWAGSTFAADDTKELFKQAKLYKKWYPEQAEAIYKKIIADKPGSDDELNRFLLECCEFDLDRILRGKCSLSKKQLLAEDRIAAIVLPDDTFDYRKTTSTFASSVSLARYDTNDYSVPVRWAHHSVTVKASVSFIEAYQQDKRIAKHRRCWGREQQIFDPLHYLELLEHYCPINC